MPQPNKQRQIVDDLGIPAPLQPLAHGNESYVRPDVESIGAPPVLNPMLQLGQALVNLNPALTRWISVQAPIDTEKAYAEAATEFYGPNRDKWVQATRSGQIPEGANPHFVRAIQRLDLKTQADLFPEYLLKSYQDGYGGAKDSDDPAVLMKAMTDLQDKFAADVRGRGRYNTLDLNEVLFPTLQRAEKALHGFHTNYRIQEHEKQGEQAVGIATGQIIANGYTDHRDVEALKNIGAKINVMLRDNLSGVVPNGMRGSRANEVVIDRVVADAVAAGDPQMAQAILRHITTNDGKNNLAETTYAKTKMEAASHAIIQWEHQQDTIKEYKETEGYRRRQREFSEESIKHSRDTWARDKATNDTTDLAKTHLKYGMRLLSMPSPDGKTEQEFETVARELEQVDAKEGAWLRNFAHTVRKQRAEYIETPEKNTQIAKMRLDMMRDPMTFDERRLAAALEGDVISQTQFYHQMDELSRERRSGENPLMTGPAFTGIVHRVEKGVQKTRDAEFDPNVMSDITDAVTELRANAREWIEKNPQGGPAAFEVYMAGKGRDITERFSKSEQDALRETARQERAKLPQPAPKKPRTDVPHPPVGQAKPVLDYKAVQLLTTDEAQADVMETYRRFSAPATGETPATEREVKRAIIKAYTPVFKDDTEGMMKMMEFTFKQLQKSKKKD